MRPAGALRLALFAMLGVVFELFIVEEDLLAGGKNKFGAAVAALQDSIGEFHDRLPQNRDEAPKSAMAQEKRAGRGSLFAFVILNKGPDRR